MILKTKVYVLKEDMSEMSEIEKQAYEAKKQYLGDKLERKDMSLTTQPTDAVIDTKQGHLYIDMGDGTIRLRPLLGIDLISDEDDSPDYTFPTVTFFGDINEIYEELIKENK